MCSVLPPPPFPPDYLVYRARRDAKAAQDQAMAYAAAQASGEIPPMTPEDTVDYLARKRRPPRYEEIREKIEARRPRASRHRRSEVSKSDDGILPFVIGAMVGGALFSSPAEAREDISRSDPIEPGGGDTGGGGSSGDFSSE
jgi:hypothetical protein